jgi:hypothetical protein
MAKIHPRFDTYSQTIFNFPMSSQKLNKVILTSFNVGDVEDPMIYAADPIIRWQESDQGKWCMENCEGDIVYHSTIDHMRWGYKIVLQGSLSDKNLTYFKLRWGEVSSQS